MQDSWMHSSWTVVVGIIAGSIAFNMPKFFEYKTVAFEHPSLNVINVGIDLTDFGKSRFFKQLYHSWLYIVFVFGVPFASLAILNSFLVHAVRLSRFRGQQLNSAETKRIDTTVMLIGVVFIFFLCQLPALVSRTIWAFEDDSRASFTDFPLYTLNEIANFLIVLNSSINIVPYYFFGRRFRREFLSLFCRCLFSSRSDTSTGLFGLSMHRRDSEVANKC